jgi:hypothetical protein
MLIGAPPFGHALPPELIVTPGATHAPPTQTRWDVMQSLPHMPQS